MGSHVRNVLGKDLASIVGKYLLPDKNEMKKLYSSLVINTANETNYYCSSIITQYYYIKLHQNYKIGFIKHLYSNIFHIKYIIPNRYFVIISKQPPFDNDLIDNHYNDDYDSEYVNLFIHLENISKNDIFKYGNEKTKIMWLNAKGKIVRNY